jgi:ubiquinone/menaquinone biosynthesis C-methylase UbiE
LGQSSTAPNQVRSDDYVEYCRQSAKHARDLHDLALRGRHLKEVTRIICDDIAEQISLGPGDDLVDIGCGDGSLLRVARERGARSAIGLLATDEEVTLVRRTGLDVRQALAHQLPLPDQCASAVVCNNVLLIVPYDQIPASLREICRIAKSDARIYVGEIPETAPKDPTPQFTNRRQALTYMYEKHGFRTWLGMLRRMAWSKMTRRALTISPGTAVSFFATPREFAALSRDAGMEVIRHWAHTYYRGRNNYLLRRIF